MSRGTDATSRIGVAAIDGFFSKHDWLFREQTVHDYGIDAHLETKENKRPTGRLVALQIKTGPSYFVSENADGVKHVISDAHFDYWLRHQLPVYIMLHDPDTGITIWQKVERNLIKRTEAGTWYIRVPRTNVLDETALPKFAQSMTSDPTSFKRNHLALDHDVMRAVDAATDAFLQVFEFNHKHYRMRGAWFRFDAQFKEKADLYIERWLPQSDIHDYMAWGFPYLDYTHTHKLQDPTGAIEGETHQLRVTLNAVGRAFVDLEDFYINGVTPKTYPVPFEEVDDEDDDDDYGFRRAMERDD